MMHATPLEWWLRPVKILRVAGEHGAVVCMFAWRSPDAATRSMFGVSTSPPKQLSCP